MPYDYLILGGFVWLLILSTLLGRVFFYLKGLFEKSDKGTIENLLGKVLSGQEKNSLAISELRKKLLELENEGKLHVQRLGLVRFNPFKELGGQHSFSLAILNSKNTGVIITGLHGRERTRVYVKEIKEGKSKLELSDEEKKALMLAQGNKALN